MTTATPDTRAARSANYWTLLILAALVALLAAFVGISTALGLAHADVRGHRLTGPLEALFLVGLAVLVIGASAALVGLKRHRAWAVPSFAAIWPAFALVCLVLDRITPVPGPGRPLWFYLLVVGLAPAAAVVLLGRARKVTA